MWSERYFNRFYKINFRKREDCNRKKKIENSKTSKEKTIKKDLDKSKSKHITKDIKRNMKQRKVPTTIIEEKGKILADKPKILFFACIIDSYRIETFWTSSKMHAKPIPFRYIIQMRYLSITENTSVPSFGRNKNQS